MQLLTTQAWLSSVWDPVFWLQWLYLIIFWRVSAKVLETQKSICFKRSPRTRSQSCGQIPDIGLPLTPLTPQFSHRNQPISQLLKRVQPPDIWPFRTPVGRPRTCGWPLDWWSFGSSGAQRIIPVAVCCAKVVSVSECPKFPKKRWLIMVNSG